MLGKTASLTDLTIADHDKYTIFFLFYIRHCFWLLDGETSASKNNYLWNEQPPLFNGGSIDSKSISSPKGQLITESGPIKKIKAHCYVKHTNQGLFNIISMKKGL